MDSQEQSPLENSQEQPSEVSQTAEQPNEESAKEENLIDLPDGTQVSQDELTKGYMRQSDYTRKTKELSVKSQALDGESTRIARNTAPSAEVQLDPEVQQAAEVLKKAGFVTREDLALSSKQQSDELKLQRLLDANPDLASKEAAIRAIGKTDNRAWEDIIVEYGFKESNKIAKARVRDIKGMPTPKVAPKQKSIGEMTSAEYATWKKANLKGQTY